MLVRWLLNVFDRAGRFGNRLFVTVRTVDFRHWTVGDWNIGGFKSDAGVFQRLDGGVTRVDVSPGSTVSIDWDKMGDWG